MVINTEGNSGGLLVIEQLISIENACNNKTLNRHQPRDKAKILHVEKAQTISRASQLQKPKFPTLTRNPISSPFQNTPVETKITNIPASTSTQRRGPNRGH